MKLAAIFIFLMLQPVQAPFTRFTYCREMPRGVFEKQCLVVKPDGSGESQLKRRGSDPVQVLFNLSTPGREKFLSVIAATNNLADGKNYETRKKVADLGRKHLTLEMPGGPREADYNYSDLKEVNTLTTFFDGLLNQQTLSLDLDTAIRFERLSVPQRLNQLEEELKASRIGDPEGLIPLLDKIAQDQRVLEYARQHAEQIKNRVLLPIKGK
jgi:hypothetical protein